MPDPAKARVSAWIGEFTPQLLPVARTLCVRPDEGEDLLQEVWVVALRQEHALPEGADPALWLHRILLNVARSRGRTATRRKELLARWSSAVGMAPLQARAPTIESEQVRWILRREIAALPDLQARVVLLRVVGGLSTAETARVLHRAEGTVKVSLHRGLMRLARRLRAQGVDFAQAVA